MKESPRFETLPLGLLLALAGGSLDCYTYLNRGQVFATAETGNLVMMGARLALGDWVQALHYLPPILAFAAGVLATELLRSLLQRWKLPLDWRKWILLLECAVVAAVALLPLGRWDLLANGLISFTSAMQVESFRVINGCACATTMCTGNLRSAAERFYLFWTTGDPSRRTESLHYCGIILSFIGGAALGTFCCRLFAGQAVLICCGFLLLAFGMMSFRNSR